MQCPNCQSPVQPGARFCTVCGASCVLQAANTLEPPAGQSTTIMVVPAPKNKGTALAIEAIAAIFGIFGAGWLYSGNTPIGIMLLIAGFCWDVLAFIVLFFSLGFGVFCLLPLHLLLVLGSVLFLSVVMPKTAL